MNDHLEDTLRRELREVADGLPVPPRPALRQSPARPGRHWRPLLVAAAVTLIVGVITALAVSGAGRSLQPALPPTPTVGSVAPVRPLSADAPTVPYLFDGRLYAGGSQVPGAWASVQQARGVWVAQRTDDTWWWGTGSEPHAIEGTVTLLPHLSPDGTRLAVSRGDRHALIDTRSGETVNELPIDPAGFGVVAVTDDEQVFLSDGTNQLMWLGSDGRQVVDLDAASPGRSVLASTAAGVIVQDGETFYLAHVSTTGVITRGQPVPSEQVAVNSAGTWLAFGGSWGGESETIPYVSAQTLDRSRELKLQPPDQRELLTLTWEDDDLLLAELYTDGTPTGLARCSIREERCLKLDVP
ncbi:YncE family protein [Microlunatus speluncae]|uniref:YncE family protein n=1 Tax=Microlunatus speluncae TaxID=2594267 RepID=UPI0012661CD6|nr:hypothetical protein [Microlunatus speluncae]